MIAFINTHAAAGTALVKWKRIAAEFHRRFGPLQVCQTEDVTGLNDLARRALRHGETDFVAAGGDGTVNALINSILTVSTSTDLTRVRIGAVGLGSSNDFHKPFMRAQFIDDVPCKVGFRNSYLRDIGCLSYEVCGRTERRYFIANASIGVTAEANLFFNEPSPELVFLKRVSVEAAILYAAIRTILLYKNFPCTLDIGHREHFTTRLTNLAVMKSPHVSGQFLYDTPVDRDNGIFAVNLSEGMSKLELLNLLISLGRGRFTSLDHTRTWRRDSVHVSSSRTFAVEYDGEVLTLPAVTFSVLRKHLRVCP
jgi:diacylglycerol kinase (ATP)